LGWLVVGVALMLIASIKLHGPRFLPGTAWLTYGRVAPAGLNAVVYGFACPVAVGLVLWLSSRLGRVRLAGRNAVLVGVVGWNLGVLLGVAGILAGHSTGFSWLEMPGWVGPILLLSLTLMAVGWPATVAARAERALYVSDWFGVAVLLGLLWAWAGAQWFLAHRPVRGVVQSVVTAWYRGVLLEVCLGAGGLAALFYFVPKLAGHPLHSRSLAALSFWVLVLVGGWTGCVHLLGGPVPAWMISVGTVAMGLLLANVVAVGLNAWRTVSQPGQPIRWPGLGLGYMALSVGCYVLAGIEGAVLANRSVSALTRFTHLETARLWLMLLGFFGMAALGAVHELVPRLAERPWPRPGLARAHFWGTAAGLGLIWLGLTTAGLVQGIKLLDARVPVTAALRATVPCVGVATLGWLAVLLAQVALLINLGTLLVSLTAPIWQAVQGLVQPAERTAPPSPEAKA